MGRKRLKIKTELNYRRGTGGFHCKGCGHFVPDFEVMGLHGLPRGITDSRCRIIGLENSILYRVDWNGLCDRVSSPTTMNEEVNHGREESPDRLSRT